MIPTVAAPALSRTPALDGDEVSLRPRREKETGPRRIRVRISRVGPLSAFRLSLIFYFGGMLALLGGLFALYLFLSGTGALHAIEHLVNSAGIGHHFKFSEGWIFTRLFWGGVVVVVVAALLTMFLALAYNAASDLTGGLDLTLTEHGSQRAGARRSSRRRRRHDFGPRVRAWAARVKEQWEDQRTAARVAAGAATADGNGDGARGSDVAASDSNGSADGADGQTLREASGL